MGDASMKIQGIDPGRVKAAVFDLGGVILAGGVENVEQFGMRLGLTEETWADMRRELFLQPGWWDRLERGEMALDDFAGELIRRLGGAGIALSLDRARNFMNHPGDHRGMPVRAEIVAAAKAIHAAMPTALLTNNIREWRSGWRARIEVDALFDTVIDSSEVGMRKPEERIYAYSEEKIGLRGEELFFVDDLGMNLKPARDRGWQTLKYVDTADVLEVLHALNDGRPPR